MCDCCSDGAGEQKKKAADLGVPLLNDEAPPQQEMVRTNSALQEEIDRLKREGQQKDVALAVAKLEGQQKDAALAAASPPDSPRETTPTAIGVGTSWGRDSKKQHQKYPGAADLPSTLALLPHQLLQKATDK